jgi:hypothetical protein
VLQFLELVRNLAESNVVSAYFRYDGTRVDGSDKIEIECYPYGGHPEAFWLRVKPIADYVFVRVPINASGVQEQTGTCCWHSGGRSPAASINADPLVPEKRGYRQNYAALERHLHAPTNMT